VVFISKEVFSLTQSTKKWVVDDIANAALFDLASGDPVAFFERLKKMTITIDAKQQREYGGTSKFAFHLTEQDSESGVQIENAVLDYNQLIAATGATLATGSTVIPFQEKITVQTGPTVTLTKAASMVATSERIIVATKGLTNSGLQLTRVASAPTAGQYSIAAGVVTFGDATLVGKDVRAFYDYTATSAETASVVTTTKNKPYKFVAYGKAFDDELNTYFDVTVIIYKTQMLGSFTIDMQRKSATTNTLDLAVLDGGRPDGKVIDIIAT
jgi:hypothetical protein